MIKYFCFCILFMLCQVANAEPRFSITYSSDWKKITGIHGVVQLALDIANDDPHCGVEFFKGKVINFKDYGDHFLVNVNNKYLNKVKDHLIISTKPDDGFTPQDNKNIAKILSSKSNMIFSTYICGSGGVPYVDSVIIESELVQ